MQKQEFIDLTGLNPTDEEYYTIEQMYILAGDMDKETFCKNYVKIKDNELLMTLYFELKRYRDSSFDAKESLKESAQLMVKEGYEWDVQSLREQGRKVLGDKEYVKYILSSDIEMSDEDKKLTISLL